MLAAAPARDTVTTAVLPVTVVSLTSYARLAAWALADETGRFLLQDRVHEQKFLLPGGHHIRSARTEALRCAGLSVRRVWCGGCQPSGPLLTGWGPIV